MGGAMSKYWTFELPIVAFLLTVPIVLFSIMNYDINPAFFLAPVIALAMLKNYSKTCLLFFVSLVCGAASILLANKVSPDGELKRHFLALILLMFAPSFIFLGQYLSMRHTIQKLLFWLAIFSSIFVVFVAARILVLNEPVRVYIGPLGLAAMNAEFIGLPVFATFGVLSLADLFCIQAVILCGAALGDKIQPLYRWSFLVAFGCAIFLVLGSDSRSAQMLIAWIIGSILYFAWRHPEKRRLAALALLAAVLAGGLTYARGMNENRMAASIKEIGGVTGLPGVPGVTGGPVDAGETVEVLRAQADTFATGRVELAIAGAEEVAQSPIIGNGFSSYGRYDGPGASKILAANTSTHVYYLTLIWKGGLIFFIPFIAMLLLNLRKAWIARAYTPITSERFFTWSAVLMTFGPMALAWDILIVPSAGALAFFLFGALSGNFKRA